MIQKLGKENFLIFHKSFIKASFITQLPAEKNFTTIEHDFRAKSGDLR
jgi:hypothetical protein